MMVCIGCNTLPILSTWPRIKMSRPPPDVNGENSGLISAVSTTCGAQKSSGWHQAKILPYPWLSTMQHYPLTLVPTS